MRAHAPGAHAPLIGFLRINRSVLALSAIAIVIGSVAVHEIPAQAATDEAEAAAAGQHVTVSDDTALPVVSSRDSFSVVSYSVVQWPANPASPISRGFGVGGHRGVDFLPGVGTPIAAIADGVVTELGDPSGELGVHVTIQHDIDGVIVSSVYGHMQLGSMNLHVGQTVKRGQLVGRVGDTGESTGPHLHLGILNAAGTPIDPLVWMRAHVTQAWAG